MAILEKKKTAAERIDEALVKVDSCDLKCVSKSCIGQDGLCGVRMDSNYL